VTGTRATRDPRDVARGAPGDAVAGVVLAAGLARRFGGGKLSAPLQGKPLVDHALATTRAAVDAGYLERAIVVAARGPSAASDAPTVRELAASYGLIVIDNGDPGEGLSRSVRLGLEALEAAPVGAAMMLLGDQPRTRLDVIAALVERWTARPVGLVAPRYADGGQGNPVIVARELWPLAATLDGDRGLGVIFGGRSDVAYVDVPGANPDVDTPVELAALTRDDGTASGPPSAR